MGLNIFVMQKDCFQNSFTRINEQSLVTSIINTLSNLSTLQQFNREYSLVMSSREYSSLVRWIVTLVCFPRRLLCKLDASSSIFNKPRISYLNRSYDPDCKDFDFSMVPHHKPCFYLRSYSHFSLLPFLSYFLFQLQLFPEHDLETNDHIS